MILFHRPYDIGHFVTASVTGGDSMNLASTLWDIQWCSAILGSIWAVWLPISQSEPTVDMMFSIDYGDDMDKAEALITQIVADLWCLRIPSRWSRFMNWPILQSCSFIALVKTTDYWTVHWGSSSRWRQLRWGSLDPLHGDVRIHHINSPGQSLWDHQHGLSKKLLLLTGVPRKSNICTIAPRKWTLPKISLRLMWC